MNKEKKIKVSLIIGLVLAVGLEIIRQNYFCYYDLFDSGYYYKGCFMNKYFQDIIKPVFLISISLFITSILTFFISDKIFKKWLIFTPFYLLLTAFLVYKAPVFAGGALGVGPTKELVSIWMGILFAIISTIMFIWMSVKEKK